MGTRLNLNQLLALTLWLGVLIPNLGHAAPPQDRRGPNDRPSRAQALSRDLASILDFPSQFDLEDGKAQEFCEQWNPEFKFRGKQCCGEVPWKIRRRGIKCNPARSKSSFCGERTYEQEVYSELLAKNPDVDVLQLIEDEKKTQQGYCSYGRTGFLAYGRPIVPSARNRVVLRRPDRCSNFGTDPMVGMVEWVGREIAREYPEDQYKNAFVFLGDVSAPRGGCLMGAGGRRGHKSHTSGRDADIGFFNAKPGVPPPDRLTMQFEPETNWWFVKKIFENPYACVKVIFLDRKLIKKLAKIAAGDPEWSRVGKFLKHARGHRNHFHVRVGDGPGTAGCGVLDDESMEDPDEGSAEGSESNGG